MTNIINIELMIIGDNGKSNIIIKGVPEAFELETKIAQQIINEVKKKVDLRFRNTNIGSAIINTQTQKYNIHIKNEYLK